MGVRRTILVWSAVAIGLGGCDTPPYPGMDRIGEEIYWRLHRLGDGEAVVTDSDRVSLTYRIARLHDVPGSLYSAQRMVLWSVDEAKGLTPAMTRMREGDSATVAIPSRKVPWGLLTGKALQRPADTTMIRIDLRLDAMMSAEEAQRMEAELDQWKEQREQEEMRSLHAYLMDHNIDTSHHFLGLHHLIDRPGSGDTVRYGDLVSIHYTARFLDGTVFDDTRQADTPLTFGVGDPDQVIEGLEVGVQSMRLREIGTLIIPSTLAFGHRGSVAGIVPPFTTVIYQVEVVEVHGRDEHDTNSNL